MHQGQVRVPALEPDALVLQFAQLRKVRDRHARELAFPFVIGRLADAVLPARLADLGAQFDLLEDGNDLAFTGSWFSSRRDSVGWNSLLPAGSGFRGGFNEPLHIYNQNDHFNDLPA